MNPKRKFLIVVVGGMSGALITILDALGDPNLKVISLLALALLIVTPLVKGGAASGIGVYLLVPGEIDDPYRTFFFSLACGLAFPSVLQGGVSMAEHLKESAASKAVYASAAKIEASVKETGTSARPDDAEALLDASARILDAQQTATPEARLTGFTAVHKAYSALQAASTKGHAPAQEALKSLQDFCSTSVGDSSCAPSTAWVYSPGLRRIRQGPLSLEHQKAPDSQERPNRE